ncbi:MAG: sigma-54 dependent transcriptional regulator, partial [Bacteroidota bacterium]
VRTEVNPTFIPELLAKEPYDVIVLDMNFSMGATSGQEGLHWLKEISKIDATLPVILNTAYGDIKLAVEAMKEGAIDFVVKPWENEKFLATVMTAYKLRRSSQQVANLKSTQQILSKDLDQQFSDIISQSAAMEQVFNTIRKVAQTDANVLILGENGTGKELIARAIHRQSLRHDQTFIKVDLGAISETLFESELFGHTKGSFTDAKEDRAGRFEAAHEGTLFLDEIGNLSLPLQAKLLTALQNRQITRLGSNKAIPIDIRLICATNMPLYEMIEESQFRQDLLYRVNTVEIRLPALRERTEDIALLAEHYLQVYAKKYQKEGLKITKETLKKLESYHWPGNIRELQHAIERAVILSEGYALQPDDFVLTTPVSKNEKSHETLNMEEIEKKTIEEAIRKHEGNLSHAAKALGMGRTTLYRKMKKYGL